MVQQQLAILVTCRKQKGLCNMNWLVYWDPEPSGTVHQKRGHLRHSSLYHIQTRQSNPYTDDTIACGVSSRCDRLQKGEYRVAKDRLTELADFKEQQKRKEEDRSIASLFPLFFKA